MNEPRDDAAMWRDILHVVGDIRSDIQDVDKSVSEKIARVYDKIDSLPCLANTQAITELKIKYNNNEKFANKLESSKRSARSYKLKVVLVIATIIGLGHLVLKIIDVAKNGF